MNIPIPDFAPAATEIFLLAAACMVLLIDLFVSDERRWITHAATQLTLAGCAAILIVTATPNVTYTFSVMFVDDAMSDALKLMILVTVSVLLVYSRRYLIDRGMFRGEFFTLTLFGVLGMMVMVSANHFITLYLGLELLSLSLYAMIALQRDSSVATEAAMKYFILGALASGMLLYGMSMIYGATGSLQVTDIAGIINSGQGNRTVLVFGLVFVVAGLGFKLGVVPFHMWVPDVYHGAPTAVTLLISSAPKIAAFAFFMRILGEALEGLAPDWRSMLIVMAVLSLALGNIAAIAQTNLKRMLAYSSISHMGFLLLGILAGTTLGFGAAMFYVASYVLMNLGTFGMILLLAREGFEADQLDDYRGLAKREPWYAFMMMLLMFSMAGLPPTIGFYAKFSVLAAVVNIDLVWLAVFAVVMSLIGAFYYLRIVKLMYFDEPVEFTPIVLGADARAVMSVNGLAVLALGILPQPLMAWCLLAIERSI
ncbi:MAG: NADH-quinone oxidoreductase subunit NuoN [Proteobacteria bacterium]|nr:NADH-quinone oxidoreductase subunit NuoN [Burkholderiales bacterium]